MDFIIKSFLLFFTVTATASENTLSNKDDRIIEVTNKDVRNLSVNKTYFEKPDNVMRYPHSSVHFEQYEKKYKKMPKRTIQKIIKKNRMRVRKLYINQISSPRPTDIIRNVQKKKIELSTVKEPNKVKKNTMSILKYGMPYQKNFARNKRNIPRNDLFILKDLDEIEFLGSDKDYDVIKAHIKSYW